MKIILKNLTIIIILLAPKSVFISQAPCETCFVIIDLKGDTLIFNVDYVKKIGDYPNKSGVIYNYTDGKLREKCDLINGKRNGYSQIYENEKLVFRGSFKDGLKHGIFIYYENDSIKTIQVFLEGKFIEEIK